MLKLQTPVEIPEGKIKISPDDGILVIGSCFADNVGQKMKDLGFDVCVNPFGTLYNPASIADAVGRLASGRAFAEEECRMIGSGADMVCSFSHHTSFARKTAGEFLADANEALAEASDFYRRCSKVIITLGTSWCFRHIADGRVVSNCLKRDAREFERFRLGVGETVSRLSEIIRTGESCGGKEYIFTVSPIRHFRDGAHGNQLSKSTLLLAVDEVCGKNGCCDYFPAYEIVMDELRDYRFYAEDMLHPSSQTVGYIWDRFCDAVVPAGDRQRLADMEKKFRQSRHRPNLGVKNT